MPVLFNVARDPGERYPIRNGSDEYMRTVSKLITTVKEHNKSITKPGKPQLNWCDESVQVT